MAITIVKNYNPAQPNTPYNYTGAGLGFTTNIDKTNYSEAALEYLVDVACMLFTSTQSMVGAFQVKGFPIYADAFSNLPLAAQIYRQSWWMKQGGKFIDNGYLQATLDWLQVPENNAYINNIVMNTRLCSVTSIVGSQAIWPFAFGPNYKQNTGFFLDSTWVMQNDWYWNQVLSSGNAQNGGIGGLYKVGNRYRLGDITPPTIDDYPFAYLSLLGPIDGRAVQLRCAIDSAYNSAYVNCQHTANDSSFKSFMQTYIKMVVGVVAIGYAYLALTGSSGISTFLSPSGTTGAGSIPADSVTVDGATGDVSLSTTSAAQGSEAYGGDLVEPGTTYTGQFGTTGVTTTGSTAASGDVVSGSDGTASAGSETSSDYIDTPDNSTFSTQMSGPDSVSSGSGTVSVASTGESLLSTAGGQILTKVGTSVLSSQLLKLINSASGNQNSKPISQQGALTQASGNVSSGLFSSNQGTLILGVGVIALLAMFSGKRKD